MTQEAEIYNVGVEPKESRIWPVFLIALALVVVSATTWRMIVKWDNQVVDNLEQYVGSDLKIRVVEPESVLALADFRVGDQIIAINDLQLFGPDGQRRVWKLSEWRRFSEFWKVGEVLTYTARRVNPPDDPDHPGEQLITARIPLVKIPYAHALTFFPWLSTLLAVIISLWFCARKSASLPLRLICLGATLNHGVLYAIFTNPGGSIVHWTLALGSLMVFPVIFHQALVWPSIHPWKKRFPSLPLWVYGIWGAYTIFILFSRLVFVHFLANGRQLDMTLHLTFLTACGLFLIVIGIVTIQQGKIANLLQRQQYRWYVLNLIPAGIVLFVWILLIASTFSLFYLLDRPEMAWNVYMWNKRLVMVWASFGPLLLTISGIMAVSSYRLDLAETLFKKSIMYSITSMAIALLVLVMAGGLALAAQEWVAIKEPWAIIGLTLLAVGLIMPVKNYLGNKLDRRFRREVLALSQFRDRVDESILKELNISQLLDNIMHTLENILKCSPVFLFLKDNAGSGNKWRLAGFAKLSSSEIEKLSQGPPQDLTRYLEEKPEPTSKIKLLSRTDWQMQEELPLDLVEVLENLQIDAVIPIKSRDEIQGIMCLGPKPGKKVYSMEDLALLGNISSKLGMGLANALAYEMVEKSRQSLEDEVASRTGELERLTKRMQYFLSPQLVESLSKEDEDRVWAMSKRVKLTIFFSDIKGFTETTDRMEPEEMSELLNHYLTEMCTIALKHGGTIDKFIGDAIMVFFGAPVATDDKDHALRCVRMAWEMQERMKSLREEWECKGIEAPFSIRVGVNTGYATVGSFGSPERLDYTAIGGQVNLASRLETNSEPGKILISYSTNALIQDEFETESKDEIMVKGIPRPVKTFEVIGPKQA